MLSTSQFKVVLPLFFVPYIHDTYFIFSVLRHIRYHKLHTLSISSVLITQLLLTLRPSYEPLLQVPDILYCTHRVQCSLYFGICCYDHHLECWFSQSNI